MNGTPSVIERLNHPHPPAKMDGQADRRMSDCENSRPDTYIPAQVEADRIWPTAQNNL